MTAADALLGTPTTTLSAAHALNGCYSGGIHRVLECCCCSMLLLLVKVLLD